MNYRSLNDVGPVVFLRQFNKYKMRPRTNSKNKLVRKFGARKNLMTFLKNQSRLNELSGVDRALKFIFLSMKEMSS